MTLSSNIDIGSATELPTKEGNRSIFSL